MDKSREQALILYPPITKLSKNGKVTYDPNAPRRKAFLKGYQQAKMDLLSTLKEMNKQ